MHTVTTNCQACNSTCRHYELNGWYSWSTTPSSGAYSVAPTSAPTSVPTPPTIPTKPTTQMNCLGCASSSSSCPYFAQNACDWSKGPPKRGSCSALHIHELCPLCKTDCQILADFCAPKKNMTACVACVTSSSTCPYFTQNKCDWGGDSEAAPSGACSVSSVSANCQACKSDCLSLGGGHPPTLTASQPATHPAHPSSPPAFLAHGHWSLH